MTQIKYATFRNLGTGEPLDQLSLSFLTFLPALMVKLNDP
jgi:hypothetical protein